MLLVRFLFHSRILLEPFETSSIDTLSIFHADPNFWEQESIRQTWTPQNPFRSSARSLLKEKDWRLINSVSPPQMSSWDEEKTHQFY